MIAILGRDAMPEEQVLRRALAAVPYPTPDVSIRRIGNCLVGVATRPGFVDESLSTGGDLLVALAGRIDNAAELRRDLSATGTPPASKAEADVVAAAFSTFGPEVVNRFRGAFAGIVSSGRQVWCFRDHVGFRPMFYRDSPTAFVAAGESRQVAVGAQIPEEPDLDVLEQILFGGMPSDTPAALRGVARLGQGALLSAGEASGVRVSRYWNPEGLIDTASLSAGDIRDRFLELLAQAAARSLTGADAVLLSGGLDSPTVAAFAAREHQRRTGRSIGAVSAVFPDLPAVDERPYIELVADRFGMALHTYRPTARALDNVEEWCRRFATPVPTLSIQEISDAYTLTRQLGYSNVLTGEFAEMLYGSWYHALAHLLSHGRWRALMGVVRAERQRGCSRWFITKRLLATFVPGRLANWYFERRGYRRLRPMPEWIDQRRFLSDPVRGDFLPPARQRWRRQQLWGTEGSTLTVEADAVCGAMAGVTCRRPLADIDLWEFYLSLPAEIKFPQLDYKAGARRMLRGVVPDEIIDRKRKTYFNAHMSRQVDYPTLRRLLVAPSHRMPGVDYDLLATRIEREDLVFHEWIWARDLARIHAFLSAW